MRNIQLIACFLLAIYIFVQDIKVVNGDDTNLLKSIFVTNSFIYQKNNKIVFEPWHLTGYQFMIIDRFYSFTNNFWLETRNIGRYISDDDFMDNYKKTKMYRYDVSKNSRHFIWNMWDISLQKQYQSNKN